MGQTITIPLEECGQIIRSLVHVWDRLLEALYMGVDRLLEALYMCGTDC